MTCASCTIGEDSATLKASGNYFLTFDLNEQVKYSIARTKDFLFDNRLRLKRDTERGFCASMERGYCASNGTEINP